MLCAAVQGSDPPGLPPPNSRSRPCQACVKRHRSQSLPHFSFALGMHFVGIHGLQRRAGGARFCPARSLPLQLLTFLAALVQSLISPLNEPFPTGHPSTWCAEIQLDTGINGSVVRGSCNKVHGCRKTHLCLGLVFASPKPKFGAMLQMCCCPVGSQGRVRVPGLRQEEWGSLVLPFPIRPPWSGGSDPWRPEVPSHPQPSVPLLFWNDGCPKPCLEPGCHSLYTHSRGNARQLVAPRISVDRGKSGSRAEAQGLAGT